MKRMLRKSKHETYYYENGKKIIGVHGKIRGQEVVELPRSAKKIKSSGVLVVLKGEGSNTHEIREADAVEVYEKNGVLYLKTLKPVEIVHQEHGKTTLEPNKIYRRIIEREWDYESEEARKTQD